MGKLLEHCDNRPINRMGQGGSLYISVLLAVPQGEALQP